MVSLAPSRGQEHGGFSFGHGSDRDSVRSEDVDLLNESRDLSPVVNRAQFVPLYISWIAGFEALLIFVFEIMTFILADVLYVKDLGGRDPPFSFLALLHVLLWLLIMVCHFFLIFQHNRLQLRGYLTFCHQVKHLTILPPLVLSFGNAVLLAFFSIADYAWAETRFHHYYFFQLLYSVEFVIVLPALIYYIVKVVIFNKERALPDCYTLVDNNFRLDIEGEIGYSESRWPNGILEKQADMIRYLKQHNDNLSRRLLRQTQGT